MTVKEMQSKGLIPWVMKVPDHIKKVVVHNGTFHADDVFCVAFLQECYDENITIKRIPRNGEINKYGYDTLLCDIGMEFDGRNKFDHHQIPTRELTAKELRAAVGLLWDTFGNEMYHRTTSLVRDIDRHDNDSRRFRSQLCVSIGTFNPDWAADDKERDRCFEMAVKVARQIIRASVVSDTTCMRAMREVSENSTIEESVLFLTTNAPYEAFISDYPVKMVARVTKDKFKLKAVNGYSFKHYWSGNPPFPNMSMEGWIIETTDRETVFEIAKLLR